MFATMSVQLHVTGDNEGGELIVSSRDNMWERDDDNDEEEEILQSLYDVDSVTVSAPKRDQITVTVFYQDTPHMITEVDSGYRVSLIFDVTLDPTEELTIECLALQSDLQRIKDQGVKRVGFLCNHIYMGTDLDPSQLKGTDRLGYGLFKEYATSGSR